MEISGIVPIIPTPFGAGGDIDHDALSRLIEFAHHSGACAACLPAYASEFYKLSEQEREDVVATAVAASRGRIPIIAQVNYPSTRQSVRAAVRAQEIGANAINVAVPRLFALPESDLRRHFGAILEAVRLPLVIQDFNPGGPTISPGFIAALNRDYPHFRWVKLEEPLMAGKVKAVLDAAGGSVGVIEGWGGMFILELISAGICGVMPSLSLADLLARVYQLAAGHQREEAYRVFEGLLPQIVFSLQSMELYHHAEKRLLSARGLLNNTAVREATVTPSPVDAAQIDFINQRILELLDRLGMARNPVPAAEPV